MNKKQYVITLFRTSTKKEQNPEYQKTAFFSRHPELKPDKIVWIDDETGDDKERVIFEREFLAEIKEKVKTHDVIAGAFSIDRITRNYRHLQDVLNLHDYNGLKIYTLDGNLVTTSDRTLFSLKVFIANEFLQNLRRAQKEGIRAKIEGGKHTGGIPAGYTRTKQKGVFSVDPIKGFGVKRIFEEFSEGKNSLASYLKKAQKIAGQHSFSISSAERLRTILRNPFYKGFTRDPKTKELFSSQSPALIPLHMWEECNSLLDSRHHKKIKEHKFIYKGAIRTPSGALLTGDRKKGRHGKGNYVYYQDKQRLYSALNEVQINQDISEYITEINNNLDKEKIIEACKSFRPEFEREKIKLEQQHKNQIANIDGRLNRLLDMRENGEVTADEYRERKSILLNQREKLSTERSEEENIKMSIFFDIPNQLFETMEMAAQSYLEGNDEKKANLLKLLVRNMIWDGNYLTIKATNMVSAMVNFDKSKTWCTLLGEVRNTITLEELQVWNLLTPSQLEV